MQGISSIMALDVDDERLERAVRLGASCQVNVRREDPQRVIHRLTGGEGADVVIEASGVPSAPPLALSLARRGGRVLLVGLQATPCTLDLHDQVLREVALISSNGHVCDIDLPAAVTLLSAHDFATQMVDRVIGLENLVPDGLVALADKRAKGKVLVALH
jgi:(R,R)-butanediol dehydrogenase/meso-butanediol dehydrogenase/diacetyl reductase